MSVDENIMTKNKMHQIGFMQGRLSPVSKEGIIQEFPATTWKNEFPIARECGFEIIEWVFEAKDWEKNPLILKSGRQEIIEHQEKFGIQVDSVCCDYFMGYPVLEDVTRSRKILESLIEACFEVGIRSLEIPFIEKNAITSDEDAKAIADILNSYIPLAEEKGVYLLLEVSLNPEEICKFLKLVPSERIQLNYDSGNSANWGFKPEEEIPRYGYKIGNIHIKDCTPEEYTVPLGQGNANFDVIFELLKEEKYEGNFILQTARGSDDVGLAKEYLKFTQDYIQKYLK